MRRIILNCMAVQTMPNMYKTFKAMFIYCQCLHTVPPFQGRKVTAADVYFALCNACRWKHIDLSRKKLSPANG